MANSRHSIEGVGFELLGQTAEMLYDYAVVLLQDINEQGRLIDEIKEALQPQE